MAEQNTTAIPFLRIVKKGQETDDIFYWLNQEPIERKEKILKIFMELSLLDLNGVS